MQDLLLPTNPKLSVVIVYRPEGHTTHMWFMKTVLKGAQTSELPHNLHLLQSWLIMGSCPHVRIAGTSRTPDKNTSHWQRIAKACNFIYIVDAH